MLRKFLQARRFQRSAAGVSSAAKTLASTQQMQLMREAAEELMKNPPRSLSRADEAVLKDIFEHPEDYAHLHPQSYTLAEVAAAEMEIKTALMQFVAEHEDAPSASPEEIEFLADALRSTTNTSPFGSNLTDSPEYRKLRKRHKS